MVKSRQSIFNTICRGNNPEGARWLFNLPDMPDWLVADGKRTRRKFNNVSCIRVHKMATFFFKTELLQDFVQACSINMVETNQINVNRDVLIVRIKGYSRATGQDHGYIFFEMVNLHEGGKFRLLHS